MYDIYSQYLVAKSRSFNFMQPFLCICIQTYVSRTYIQTFPTYKYRNVRLTYWHTTFPYLWVYKHTFYLLTYNLSLLIKKYIYEHTSHVLTYNISLLISLQRYVLCTYIQPFLTYKCISISLRYLHTTFLYL